MFPLSLSINALSSPSHGNFCNLTFFLPGVILRGTEMLPRAAEGGRGVEGKDSDNRKSNISRKDPASSNSLRG